MTTAPDHQLFFGEPVPSSLAGHAAEQLTGALDELVTQLWEQREMIDGIRCGDVDSLVIGRPGAEQIYSLSTADRPYRLVVESMNEGAATLSEGGLIVYANPYLADMVGLTASDLLGTALLELVKPADRSRCAELLKVGRDEKRRATSEMVATDGNVTPVSISVSGFELRGTVLRCVIVSDISRLRETELALASRAEDLQRLNAELARSNDDLARFAYAASHDLSEPIRAIADPLSLLARRYVGRLDAESDQFIRFAVDGCRRMQQLIDSLLAYSRLGSSLHERQDVECDLIMKFVLDSLRAEIDATSAVVEVAPLPKVAADGSLLGQVLHNLISNAIKFVAPGVTPRVGVTATLDGGEWRFSVIDNGIGIDPRHRERVLDLFQRLDDGYGNHEGAGIGLAIVKRIVDHHHGRMGITDVPGGGTCVWFTLPNRQDPDAAVSMALNTNERRLTPAAGSSVIGGTQTLSRAFP